MKLVHACSLLLSLALTWGVMGSLWAQTTSGIPHLTYYSPRAYQAGSANYGMEEGDDGKIFVANQEGILVFDGHRWEVVHLREGVEGRWMKKAPDGTIYVGATNDFGYLETSLNGTKFVSLLHLLDSQYHHFQDIWELDITSQGVYFRSVDFLFRYNNNQIKVWERQDGSQGFDVIYAVRDTIYTRLRGKDIVKMVGDEFVPVAGSKRLADSKINAFLPYRDDEVLICTRYEGVYALDHSGIRPVNLDLANNYNIYHGLTSPGEEYYVFPTLNKGILVTDNEVNSVFEFNTDNGLPFGNALYAFYDRSGSLWMGLEKGIARAVFPPSVMTFGQKNGIMGTVRDIEKIDHYLYVATSNGAYYLDLDKCRKNNVPYNFQRITGLNEECLHFHQTVEGKVIVTTTGKDYEIKNFAASPSAVLSFSTRDHLNLSQNEYDYLAIDYNDGVYLVRNRNGRIEEFKLNEIKEQIYTAAEDHHGNIWMGSYNEGLIRWEPGEVQRYFPGRKVKVIQSERFPLILSGGKVYTPAAEGDQLVMHPLFKEDSLVADLVEGPSGSLVMLKSTMLNSYDAVLIRDQRGHYQRSYLSNIGLDKYNAATLLLEKDSILWIGGMDGLMRWKIKLENQPNPSNFKSYISGISLEGGSADDYTDEENSEVTLPYSSNSLRIFYSTNVIPLHGQNVYQIKLEGFEDNWSGWTAESQKDYTGLGPGNYRLLVRARNSQGQVSETASLHLNILAPWWQTPGVMVLFFLLALVSVYGLFLYRTASIRRRNRQLEVHVEERTREIKEKNDLLSSQKEELEGLNEIKDKLLSIISHDVRGPLNSLSGILHLFSLGGLSEGELQKVSRDTSNKIQGLTHFLENLVRWAKKSLHGISVNLTDIEIENSLLETTRLLASTAQDKSIEIEYVVESGVKVTADKDMLDLILRNLLTNAIKFSNEKSKVKITVEEADNFALISIHDQGTGISQEDIDQLFTRKTLTTSGTNNEVGTGLGLSLCYDFVTSQNGEIGVESVVGKGSTFWFTIPLSNRSREAVVDN